MDAQWMAIVLNHRPISVGPYIAQHFIGKRSPQQRKIVSYLTTIVIGRHIKSFISYTVAPLLLA